MWICYTIATFKTMKRTLSIAINRSELAAATIGMNQYGYEYDTIGVPFYDRFTHCSEEWIGIILA